MAIHPKHQEWLTARGIDPELADRLGLHTHKDDQAHWLRIPYREAGETVNHKWRQTEQKQHRMDGKGAPLALWNADALTDPKVRAGQASLVITEGEWDAIVAMQVGFPNVVSLPNGGSASRNEDPETAAAFAWVDRHAEALREVREFIIATDADEVGFALANDIVGLLGADRCRFVEYPFPCKDLNEVLLEYGQERVVECLASAKPYPIQGLYTIDDFPERGEVRAYDIGVPAIDELIKLVTGTLTVLTGYANMGKSSLMNAIIAHAMLHHFPVCVASFETDVKPILRDGIRMALLKCGKHDLASKDTSTADQLIRDRLTIISQSVDEDMEMDVEKFLDLCRVAVVRHGAKMFVLDPWNELEHKKRRDESETDYIGRAIRVIKRFAKQYDVAFWIVAHPTKPKEGDKRIPGLYEISGCYSDDTEVLTKRGWLRHSDLAPDDHVACFDRHDGSIRYEVPQRIIRKPYRGPMYRFKGYGYDLSVTPEHRMLVKPMWTEPKSSGRGRPTIWQKGEWTFCRADELPSAPFNLPLAGKFEGCDSAVDEKLAAVAGWYVSEGGAQSSGVAISQAEGEKANQIAALLTSAAIPFTVHRSGPGGKGGKLPMQSFYIGARNARPIVEWLRAECGVGSANKCIPQAILNGPRSVREAFFFAYLSGDGTYRENRGTHAACTTSPLLRDQLQRMAIELGFSCCWTLRTQAKPHHSPSWHLVIGTNGRDQTAVRPYRNLTMEDYDGLVWCLTVSTGAYVVRRNGRAVICGNSAHWANKPDYGLTYHRASFEKNEAIIMISKVRMGLPGRKGTAKVTFDFRTSEFKALD